MYGSLHWVRALHVTLIKCESVIKLCNKKEFDQFPVSCKANGKFGEEISEFLGFFYAIMDYSLCFRYIGFACHS